MSPLNHVLYNVYWSGHSAYVHTYINLLILILMVNCLVLQPRTLQQNLRLVVTL